MSSSKKDPLARRVRRAYSQETLARICVLPEHRFGRAFGMETTEVPQNTRRWQGGKKNGKPDVYHFRDNGSSVLAVAHLDTVVRAGRRTPHFGDTKAGPVIVSGALDDRLGAYVILRLLPALGVTCDWLLTVGEESMSSTAAFFEPTKDYDWVIEFDRGGTDVVMYQYDDVAARDAVEAAGAVAGTGSFTDICVLEHMGVKAFNWGVGYEGNYHSENGYAFLGNTFAMVAKYMRFHEQNTGTYMEHVPERRFYEPYSAGVYSSTMECAVCAKMAVVDGDYCEECGSCQGCSMSILSCLCYRGRALSGTPAGLLPGGEDDGSDLAAEAG